jgi:hypothetical protein
MDDYNVFEKWFDENEIRFHQGQFSEKQIAYSAYCEGKDSAMCEANSNAVLVAFCGMKLKKTFTRLRQRGLRKCKRRETFLK